MLTGAPERAIRLSAGLATIAAAIWMPYVISAGQQQALAQSTPALVRAAELPELRAIDVFRAWRLTRGRGVTVAVLDTGTDPGTPDLAGSVIRGPDFTSGADPAGYRPPHLHGTYIASLIAGHGSGAGRAEGIIGVAPNARVLSVRVILDDQEPGFAAFNENAAYYDAIARGLRYAVEHGADVINMSLGSTFATRNLRDAVGYAISRGVVVVAAAGNNGAPDLHNTPYVYPASFTGVLSVAAVDYHGTSAPFSARNASVLVSAPGVDVPGAGPGGTYIAGSGTSPASALVAGTAALIRSRFPGLSPALVIQAIIGSTRRRPPGGYSTRVGFGEVDAGAAVASGARLAASRPSAGLAPAAHFGGGSEGGITVVHRDIALIAGLALVSAIAFGCAVAAVARLAFAGSRGRRGRGSHVRRG